LTTQEYDKLRNIIVGSSEFSDVTGEKNFRWELLKALWAIERALKSGLEA
jgi:hypothetical protein